MTTQSHNPDDALSYYETVLPAVIAAVRRGENWEYKSRVEERWYHPGDQKAEHLYWTIYSGYRVRLAPVPVVKLWDCIEDLPAATVWLRWKSNPSCPMMAIGLRAEGIQYIGNGGAICVARWGGMSELEHSTDLRHWSECVKPEGGK